MNCSKLIMFERGDVEACHDGCWLTPPTLGMWKIRKWKWKKKLRWKTKWQRTWIEFLPRQRAVFSCWWFQPSLQSYLSTDHLSANRMALLFKYILQFWMCNKIHFHYWSTESRNWTKIRLNGEDNQDVFWLQISRVIPIFSQLILFLLLHKYNKSLGSGYGDLSWNQIQWVFEDSFWTNVRWTQHRTTSALCFQSCAVQTDKVRRKSGSLCFHIALLPWQYLIYIYWGKAPWRLCNAL